VDEIDKNILRALMREPDLPMTELADRVSLSQTPCWRRVKRLEEQGVIKGRALLLDPGALGLSVSVFAHVKLKRQDEDALEAFEAAILKCDSIVECFSMTGDSDYLLRVVVGTLSEYEQFLKKVLLHKMGVAAVNSSFALKEVKATLTLPL
jgi:Lrp/AsnC family transcriptional regulator